MPQTTDRHSQPRALPVNLRDQDGGGMHRMLDAVSADVRMLRAVSVDIAHAADPRHGAQAADRRPLRTA